MEIWPTVAYHFAVVLTRYRLTLEACFRRLDTLLDELKAQEQQTQI
jgi:hypothetical protein